MKIRCHFESHPVDFADGSRWQAIWISLAWNPETDLTISPDDDVASHALVGAGIRVRVIPAGESWPVCVSAPNSDPYRR